MDYAKNIKVFPKIPMTSPSDQYFGDGRASHPLVGEVDWSHAYVKVICMECTHAKCDR